MKKFIVSITVLLVITINGFSQVGGISGSKLGAYCVDVVDHHKLEFEPAIYHFQSRKTWDNNGNLNNFAMSGDSIKYISGINFRITYGLLDKLEIGTSFSTDLQLAGLGFRYVFFDNEKQGLAIMGGANIPIGNKTIDRSLRLSNTITSVGGGIVYSKYFNPDFSVDLNASYFHFVEHTADNHNGSIYANADFGYYFFNHQLQVIAGFGYQHNHYKSNDVHLLTFFPGVTIETGKRYIIVISAPFDVTGRNTDKAFGVSLALTLTID